MIHEKIGLPCQFDKGPQNEFSFKLNHLSDNEQRVLEIWKTDTWKIIRLVNLHKFWNISITKGPDKHFVPPFSKPALRPNLISDEFPQNGATQY